MNWRADYGPWAVVTGASAGLGAEYAAQLAARGLDLVLVARREDLLEQLAAKLRAENGVQVRICALDLLDESALPHLRDLAAELEVGLLVNNAGFSFSGHFLEADPETYRRMTRLNCEVPALLAQTFLKPMVERRRGGTILLASLSAFQATPYCTVYGATKGFDLLLGEGIAVELADSGLSFQTVCPGGTATELQAVAGVPQDYVEKRLSPEFVVRRSLETFGRVNVLIPSRWQRFLVWIQRLGSRGIAARTAGRLLKRRLP